LRIRFIDENKSYELTYIIDSDLDNYARSTGFLYLKEGGSKEPGLEALLKEKLKNTYLFCISSNLDKILHASKIPKRSVMRSMIFVAVFVIVAIGHSSIHGIEVSTDSNKVVVHYDARYMETTYRIASGACQISWTVHKSELNRGVVQHRSKCTLPLSKQLPLLSQILAEILKDTENARSFHTLFWGRLSPDVRNGNLDMSFRLAMAAYRSSLWDAKGGKPKTGHTNTFVMNLAIKSNIYSEMKRLFENFDRKLELASVEKVLIMEAGKLPFFDQLKKHGVKVTDKLPFDCLTWFSVSTIIRQ
jgi:hypothetical protein